MSKSKEMLWNFSANVSAKSNLNRYPPKSCFFLRVFFFFGVLWDPETWIFQGFLIMILLLIIFGLSIVDGKEVNQKTLSAKLFLKMKSDKPQSRSVKKKRTYQSETWKVQSCWISEDSCRYAFHLVLFEVLSLIIWFSCYHLIL